MEEFARLLLAFLAVALVINLIRGTTRQWLGGLFLNRGAA